VRQTGGNPGEKKFGNCRSIICALSLRPKRDLGDVIAVVAAETQALAEALRS
jgi:hypothetical protein